MAKTEMQSTVLGLFVDGDAILDGILAKVSIGAAGGVCDDA